MSKVKVGKPRNKRGLQKLEMPDRHSWLVQSPLPICDLGAARRCGGRWLAACSERDHLNPNRKTGIWVHIPILPELKATLEAGPTGDLAFIANAGNGNPLSKESLGNLFAEACRAAGVRKSAHGLRKAAATNAANHGATVAELEAIFGWQGGQMASLYTRSANRRALSAGAMTKLSRTETETSIPAPHDHVRAPERKA